MREDNYSLDAFNLRIIIKNLKKEKRKKKLNKYQI